MVKLNRERMRYVTFMFLAISVCSAFLIPIDIYDKTTYIDRDDVLHSGSNEWNRIPYDARASRITITLDVEAEREFLVKIVNSSAMEDSTSFIFGPSDELREGRVGNGTVEFTLKEEELDGSGITIWRFNTFSSTDVIYTEEMTVETVTNPLVSWVLWLFIIVLAITLGLNQYRKKLPIEEDPTQWLLPTSKDSERW
jgi:hypothetical protein